MRITAIICILCIFLSGCVVTTIHTRPVRAFNSTYDTVWDLTIAYLEKYREPIIVADKEQGIIQTDWVIYKVVGARRYYYDIQIAKTAEDQVAVAIASPQQEYSMGDWEDMLPNERRAQRMFRYLRSSVRKGGAIVLQKTPDYEAGVEDRPYNRRIKGGPR